MVLSYGYVLGMLAVAHGLGMQGIFGLPLDTQPILALSVSLLMAAMIIIWRNRASRPYQKKVPSDMQPLQWLFFGLILSWLAIRLIDLTLEIWWQPLFPWDAWTTWAVRSRVWTELRDLAHFVSPPVWLNNPDQAFYTIDAWNYPTAVSLIATWPALAYGSWNETAANIPWLGAALALAVGFYTQSRLWGASPLTAIIFLWLLMSLPILNTHIALAGYADLWLATVLGLGFMSFMQWLKSGNRLQALLALVFILACPGIKREGLIWAMFFLPATLAAKLGIRSLLGLAIFGLAMGIALWVQGGIDIDTPLLGHIHIDPEIIQLPLFGEVKLGNHSSWDHIVRHYFLYSNWHLFPYLLLVSVVAASIVIWQRKRLEWFKAGLTWTWINLLCLYLLFTYTEAYLWAIQGTSINRLMLHLIPALIFWTMSIWHELALSDKVLQPKRPDQVCQ